MALLSAYANVGEYKQLNKHSGADADALITEELLAASRRIERMLGVTPGYFNTHAETYTFDGGGGPILRLRDSAGRAYCLTGINGNGVGVDTERDASYDGYSWDLADAWVRGLPANAAAGSEPFTALELLNITTAPETRWPTFPAAVQVTGTWGWLAVPGVVRDVTAALVRDLLELHRAGAFREVQTLDGSVPMTEDTFGRWMSVASSYSRKLPVVA
jgi:hypothetical protein